MASLDIIRSVPPEIICAILVSAGVNDKITTRTWKKALSFLWVCREWRLAAEPILYSMVICGNEFKHCHKTTSNVELIVQRRCIDKVSQIYVYDEDYWDSYTYEHVLYPDNLDMMVAFGKLIDDDDGAKDVNTLELVALGAVYARERDIRSSCYYNDRNDVKFDFKYFSDKSGNRVLYDKDLLDSIFWDASTNIVSRLVTICPNVTHLFLDLDDPPPAQKMLANKLVNHYMKQLVKFKCDAFGIDFELKDGHNLQSIVLNGFEINSRQSSQLPPNKVKNIEFQFGCDFSWDLFSLGDHAPVSYDNITRLRLSGRDININENEDIMSLSVQSSENPPLVVFPRLQVLMLRDINISYNSLKHFLQFPVKVIGVDGNMKHAYQLYEHDLGNIDRLILRINCYNFLDDNNAQFEFIQLTNKLFAKMKNIPEVHLELDMHFVAFDWTEISCVHLTHFYAYVGKQSGLIFGAMSMMPDLVWLEIKIGGLDRKDSFKNIIESITELKHNCTEPLMSKIKNVVITCLNIDPSAEFIEALEFLNWYLPKLEKLTIRRG